jgi:hypothetical protein
MSPRNKKQAQQKPAELWLFFPKALSVVAWAGLLAWPSLPLPICQRQTVVFIEACFSSTKTGLTATGIAPDSHRLPF